jgi:hypothetical protein
MDVNARAEFTDVRGCEAKFSSADQTDMWLFDRSDRFERFCAPPTLVLVSVFRE